MKTDPAAQRAAAYTKETLLSDMILCLRELDHRLQPNTCRVLGKLGTDYEALLQERDAAYRAGLARGKEMESALRNCHMLARRKVGKDETWQHVIRLCESAGVTSATGILREDAHESEGNNLGQADSV